MPSSLRVLAFPVLLALGAPTPTQATTMAFTDASAFQAAIFQCAVAGVCSATGTLDFESVPADTLLTSVALPPVISEPPVFLTGQPSVADVLGGPPLLLQVVGLNQPGTHVLGTDDPGNFDAFIGGTAYAVGFTSPVVAFGLTVISADTPGVSLRDGDLELVAGGATAALSPADGVFLGFANLNGGGTQNVYAYFLGVTSDTPFSSASLGVGAGVPDAAFFYYVDDLTAAVPEPGTALSLGTGLGLLALARRRRRTQRGPR